MCKILKQIGVRALIRCIQNQIIVAHGNQKVIFGRQPFFGCQFRDPFAHIAHHNFMLGGGFVRIPARYQHTEFGINLLDKRRYIFREHFIAEIKHDDIVGPAI